MSRNENGNVTSPTGNDSTNGQRLCHIVKRDDFDGYGFNLHSEKGKPGQYIGKVDENSPAEQAGLRQGDRIIEVNGVNIGSETHKQVVQRIKAIANEVRLLVIDPNQEKKNSINSTNPVTSTTILTSTTTTTSSTTSVGSSTAIPIGSTTPEDDLNQKSIINNNNNSKIDEKTENMSGSTSPSVSVKSETNSAGCSTINNNNINKIIDKTDTTNDFDIPSPTTISSSTVSSTPSSNSHQNGTTTTTTASAVSTSPVNSNNSNNNSPTKSQGLNLPMTAAEMRAKLLAKKKYDPKNDSVDLRKKFEIIQKL